MAGAPALSWTSGLASLKLPYISPQLVYQSTVFMSRSSLSLGIPPLPSRLLSLPAILQATILITLVFESAAGIFDTASEEWSIFCVFLLISAEGICGGLA
jgi:battenin